MAEYSDMILPKELRTLEIDVDKNIFKLNGDDVERCQELIIIFRPEEFEAIVKADTTVTFKTYKK